MPKPEHMSLCNNPMTDNTQHINAKSNNDVESKPRHMLTISTKTPQ